MKLLWVKSDFLHPTTKGGHIRTLEMLRRLSRRHEIHYVAFADPNSPQGVLRSAEYCAHAYPIRRRIAPRTSPLFYLDLLRSLFSPLPIAVARYRSRRMERTILDLRASQRFDAVVCDFLTPAPNISDLGACILFQHNVETMIWRRHAEHAPDPLRRLLFSLQAGRMFRLERAVCRKVARIVAVSPQDAATMCELFGVANVAAIPTGVDIDYFTPPETPPDSAADLVFVGSMDWLPNVDGVLYFVREVLPLIRRRRPDCSLAVAGRSPSPEVLALGRNDPRIHITGTVPDVRPYLWGSRVSIVPLRIGGGTRLKIYESMAARVPVVSTTVGAEGLEIHPGTDIAIADTPEMFAARCVELLENPAERFRLSEAAWQMVSSRFSWDQVTACFEQILMSARPEVV
jgi:glycosyltransferase involved in cell wall biosynthesis